MKVLKVVKDSREVGQAVLVTPTIVVGRSPVCDLVIRNKGVAPVHFIVEWYGLGEFDASQGNWIIVSIANKAKLMDTKAEDLGFGEGYKLSQKPLELEGYEFSLQEDKLAEAHLAPGMLAGRLMQDKFLQDTKKIALEVIEVSHDSEAVQEVYHFPIYDIGEFAIPRAGGLSVVCQHRNQGASAILSVHNMPGVKAYKKGQIVFDGHTDTKAQIQMEALDFIQVHWKMRDFYFRFVPRVEVEKRTIAFFKDPYGLFLFTLTVLTLIGSLFLKQAEIKKPEEPTPPPRIAKIEIKQAVAPLPAPPPEPPSEKPQPPEPQPMKKPTDVKKQAETAKAAPVAAPKFHSEKPTKKAVTGLNSPAPKADMNNVGLLGALSKAPQPKVRADMVMNNGIISKTVSGDNSQFVIDQPPAGVVGANTKLKSSGNVISGASTTLSRGDVVSGSNTGPLIGTGKGKVGDNVSFDLGAKDKADGMDFNRSAQVSGGLDKETVRRVVDAYKKEMRTCYERALNQKSKLSGRLVYRWTIRADGPVATAKIEKSEVGVPMFEDCVLDVIKGMEFPKAPNGQPTIVIYPFVFQSSKN